jgi:hypothetical protein
MEGRATTTVMTEGRHITLNILYIAYIAYQQASYWPRIFTFTLLQNIIYHWFTSF